MFFQDNVLARFKWRYGEWPRLGLKVEAQAEEEGPWVCSSGAMVCEDDSSEWSH